MAEPSPAPSTTAPLKYSDYLAGAGIVSGIIGTSAFLVENDPRVAAYAGILTTILIALSQWLQSKGD